LLSIVRKMLPDMASRTWQRPSCERDARKFWLGTRSRCDTASECTLSHFFRSVSVSWVAAWAAGAVLWNTLMLRARR
jgi:hypothetical protein